MFIVLDKIFKQYQQIWNLRGIVLQTTSFNSAKALEFKEIKRVFLVDTRLKYMPFMDSPIPMMLLVSFYLSFVGLGKKCMEHRKPMQIDRIIIVYNIIQIVVNSYVVVMVSVFVEIKTTNTFNLLTERIFFADNATHIHW